MRLVQLNTSSKLIGAFGILSVVIVIIAAVALWRMHAADLITADLVDDKLAKQQLTSDLLGIARLNGSRAVSIARSDSLELGDYFGAQLAEGHKIATGIEARLAKLPASAQERTLIDSARARKAALATIQADLFKAKDLGQTGLVEEILTTKWEPAFQASVGALEGLLKYESSEAHRLADASATASSFSKALLLEIGRASCRERVF